MARIVALVTTALLAFSSMSFAAPMVIPSPATVQNVNRRVDRLPYPFPPVPVPDVEDILDILI